MVLHVRMLFKHIFLHSTIYRILHCILRFKSDFINIYIILPLFLNIFPGSFHSQIVLPFWNHLDVRGFGTPQPFICWLVVPFTLSMIVWYVAVMQLLEMGNLLEELGPLPVYPVTEEFVWGQEL